MLLCSNDSESATHRPQTNWYPELKAYTPALYISPCSQHQVYSADFAQPAADLLLKARIALQNVALLILAPCAKLQE